MSASEELCCKRDKRVATSLAAGPRTAAGAMRSPRVCNDGKLQSDTAKHAFAVPTAAFVVVAKDPRMHGTQRAQALLALPRLRLVLDCLFGADQPVAVGVDAVEFFAGAEPFGEGDVAVGVAVHAF